MQCHQAELWDCGDTVVASFCFLQSYNCSKHTDENKRSLGGTTSAGIQPQLHNSQNSPSWISQAGAFWDSFSCDPSIAGLQSVPAFLLAKPRRVPAIPVRSCSSMPALGIDVDGERRSIKARKNSWYIFLFPPTRGSSTSFRMLVDSIANEITRIPIHECVEMLCERMISNRVSAVQWGVESIWSSNPE